MPAQSDWDPAAFYELTGDIERYLGWLRGNEAAREWWESYQADLDAAGRPRVVEGAGYVSQPYEPDYWVSFLYHGLPGDLDPDQLRVAGTQAYEAMDESWNNGVAWADGIGGYLRDLLAPITRPQASTLQATQTAMYENRVALQGAVPVSWTELEVDGWYGEGQLAYQNVMTDLAASCVQYSSYYAAAEAWYAAVTTLVTNTQQGLIPLLEAVRDGLRTQLSEWATSNGNPQSRPGGVNQKALDVLGLGRDLVELIPGVSEVTGAIDTGVGLAVDTNEILGSPVKFDVPVEFDLESAEQVYTGLTTTLSDTYVQGFQDALDALAGTSSPVRAAVDGMSSERWLGPTITDTTPDWRHEREE